MNALLLNRDGFQMPADGWYQVAPLGEFAHAQAGLMQVVDLDACKAMANRFAEDAKAPNFAGLLVDFDHFSLDGEKRSEAAGWITGLEYRGREAEGVKAVGCRETGETAVSGVAKNTKEGEGGGLFAKIRWSDVGEEAVKGGRYRFLSPVWNRADCVDLGGGRVRPVRLLNAAVTNDPNLKGMRPLSNSGRQAEGCRLKAEGETGGEASTTEARRHEGDLANAGGEPRFKWVLGDTVGGAHCPSCTAMAGQTHTMDEWDAGGVKPGDDSLFCQGNCQCRLDPTDDPSDGPVMAGPVRNRGEGCRLKAVRETGEIATMKGMEDVKATAIGAVGEALRHARMARGGTLANIGWTDEARAASLAVRQAKAGARGSKSTGSAGRKSAVASILAKGYSKMTPAEVHQVAHALQEKAKTGGDFTPDEMKFLQDSIDDPNAIPASGIGGAGASGKTGAVGKSGGKTKKRDPELGPTDYQTWYEEDGLKGMPQKAVNAYTDQLREKMASGDEPLTETETKFLGDLTDSGYEGLNNDDPIMQCQTDRANNEKRIRDATGMSSKDAAARVGAIETKMDGPDPVTPEEQALVEAYHKAKSVKNRGEKAEGCRLKAGENAVTDTEGTGLRARAQRAVLAAREEMRNRRGAQVEVDGEEAVLIGVLVNTGWTDQARVAALAVRQAKSGARTQSTPTPVNGQVSWQLPVSSLPAGWSGTPAAGPGGGQAGSYVPAVPTGVRLGVQPVKAAKAAKAPAVQPVAPVTPVAPPAKVVPVAGKTTGYQFMRKAARQVAGGKTRAV